MISHTSTAFAMIFAGCFWTGAVFYCFAGHFLLFTISDCKYTKNLLKFKKNCIFALYKLKNHT